MRVRALRLTVWAMVSVALFIMLFKFFDVTISSALSAIISAPFWMWIVIILLNFVMICVGAIKWRIMREQVSPKSTPIGFVTLGLVTAMGNFATFFLPPQPAHLFVRWWMFRRRSIAEPGVLGSTFFEQIYDLIVYVGVAIIAILLLWLELSGPTLGFAIGFGFLIILISAPIPLAILSRIAVVLGNKRSPQQVRQFMQNAEFAFRSAEKFPVLRLMTLSMVLLVLRVLSVIAIAQALAPGVDLLMIAAGFPAVAMLAALPVTPAGLGVAEWTWSALLIAAGAATSVAAIAALGFRVINAAALLIVVMIFAIANGLKGQRPPDDAGPSKES